MPFNYELYNKAKLECETRIKSGVYSPSDYMGIYKKAVIDERYEICKDITEVLEPLNYFTIDKHRHIPHLR